MAPFSNYQRQRGILLPQERRAALAARGFDWTVVLWGIVGMAVCWIVYQHLFRLAHAGSLWRDEISSLFVATSPSLGELYWNQTRDSFPLLNVVLLRVWLALGGFQNQLPVAHEHYARIYGLVCGLLLLGCLLWVTIRVFRTPPVFSLGLFATSPVVVVWGDSLRAYALGTALMVLFFGAMWQLAQKPTGWKTARASALAVAMVWTLYGNAFFVLSISSAAAAVALMRREWRTLWVMFVPGVIAAASLFLNWPVVRIMSDAKPMVSHHVSTAGHLWLWWMALATPASWAGVAWVVCCVGSLALVGLQVFREHEESSQLESKPLAIYCFVGSLSSLVTFWVYLQIVDVPPMAWYFIPISGLLAVVMDVTWGMLPATSVKRASQIVSLLVPVVGMAFGGMPFLQARMTNIDDVAVVLEKNVTNNDLILFNPMHNACTLMRHYKGGATVQCWPPHQPEELRLQRYDVVFRASFQADDPMTPLFDRIRETLKSGNRVWMVGDIIPVALDQPPPHIAQGTVFTDRWHIGPYLYVWGAQAFHFLGTHAVSARVIEMPTVNPCSPLEQVRQMVVWEGWRPDTNEREDSPVGSSGEP